MPLRLGPGDIEAIITAIRPRLSRFIESSGPSSAGKIPPHTHHAAEIGFEPAGEAWTGFIEASIVQPALEELDDEKLARSGVQPMLGDLNMDDFSIDNVESLHVIGVGPEGIIDGVRNLDMTVSVTGEGNITGVRDIDLSNGVVGEGVIDNPRVIHMAGDLADNEALIDGLDKIEFNPTVTQAIIDGPARAEWNTGVLPGTSYTRVIGIESWSTLEDTLIVLVETTGTPFALAQGWDVIQALDGTSGGV